MFAYRISLTKYSGQLIASGNAARWSSKDIKVIYTASSCSLACLENVVHRSQEDLSQEFNVLTIYIPDTLEIKTISLNDLASDWNHYDRISNTRIIGDNWVKENRTAILQVPSSIVHEEVNYLINPGHTDFKYIKLVKTQPFIFDGRIKH